MTQSPPSGNKPPLNEQIADILVKVIMAGGVAGGGVGAFWSLFQNSDVPTALASMGLGLGTAYGAKLLQPVHKGTERRLAQTGETLDKGIERVTSQIIAKATGFEAKYRLCQAADCQRLRSEGVAQVDGILVPLLKDVYVPLALDFSAISPGFRARNWEDLPDREFHQNLDIWKLLAKSSQNSDLKHLAILAWGGYGKTTLLKHIAYRYGTQQQPSQVRDYIPFLLVLRKYREVLAAPNPPDLADLITQQHIPDLPEASELKPPVNWAKTVLKRGDGIVLLDGFDEVAQDQRSAVAAWINAQMRTYGRSVFILTSRPKAYKNLDAAVPLELPTVLWVQDFNAEQRQDFVTKWYLCQERHTNIEPDTPDVEKQANAAAADLLQQIGARQELTDLAKNPLLLNMIATFHRRNPSAKLPKRRTELYREICWLQLRDRPRARTLDTLLTECDAQTLLQHLALRMMEQRQERIEQGALLRVLAEAMQQAGETLEVQRFLQEVEEISELVVKQEDEYEFAHLSFQEYLASVQIAQRQMEGELYDRFEDDWWKPTILLYAAQVKPTTLIRAALDRGATDLAYACWQESTKGIDKTLEADLVALRSTVETSRYAALESFLKNQQWKEADDETYRLMITTVGKDEGQGFDAEELLNFPCEELRAIDGLWVKYSNGRFGFSVQKDIYLSKEIGGIADGKYHKEAWNRFCHKVAWKMNGKYVSVKFDTASPKGHLPMFDKVMDQMGLFSRITHCEL